VIDNGAGGVMINTIWDANNAKIDANLDADPSTPVIEPTELNERVPVKLDIQVCFKYGATDQCTWSQTPDTFDDPPGRDPLVLVGVPLGRKVATAGAQLSIFFTSVICGVVLTRVRSWHRARRKQRQ
jgi:hypothetical protein